MELDLDASLERILRLAKVALQEAKWDECALKSSEVISIIVAAGATTNPNVFETELVTSKIMLGISETMKNALDHAAECFLSLSSLDFQSDVSEWPQDRIALLAVLAIVGNPKVYREQIITTLTDSVKSIVREFFDEEPIPKLLNLGKLVSHCKFGDSIALLDSMISSDPVKSLRIPVAVTDTIQSNFTNFCMSESASCYKSVSIEALAQELSLSQSDTLTRLSELIMIEKARLSNYRIDLKTYRVSRKTNQGLQDIQTVNNLREVLQNLDLLAFKKQLTESGIRIDN